MTSPRPSFRHDPPLALLIDSGEMILDSSRCSRWCFRCWPYSVTSAEPSFG